jgi:glycosyltransferase involved in cell wall biosynthesis
MRSAVPRVAICIATYQRPDGLERLLAGLSDLTFPGKSPELRIVVVDNDAGGRATEQVIERWQPRFADLVFKRETVRGISYARNRALDAAGAVDFIALIDDDEAPAPSWLSELLRVQREYNADVVRGPVLPRFDNEPEPWLIDGGFFDLSRHPTGTELDVAYTHNVLLRWDPYGRDLRFSPRYARSGGSDTHYFTRAHQQGARIIWADDAVVYEWHPPSRQRVMWHLRRQYRIGLVRAVIDAELELNPHPRRQSAIEAWQRLKDGLHGVSASAIGPKHKQIAALSRMAGGLGRLAALLGFWFEEYRAK